MKTYKKFAFRGMIAGLLVAAAVFTGNVLSSTKVVLATDTGDCGASAIIPCGVKSVSEILAKYDASATIRGTYNNFRSDATPNGITRDMLVQLAAANTAGPQGLVYDTWLGGARDVVTRPDGFPIANNAMTAGRVYVNGSTTIGNFGGVTVYKRSYHLSNHSTKQAFILMDGNKFVFGILAECGNPLTADTPSVSQNKEISRDNATFTENAAFKDGETAYFRITVKETSGKAGASNVMVTDALPAGFTLVPGSTKLNGAAIADISGTATNIGLLGVGATSTVTFQAVAHIVDQACGTSHIVNTSTVSTDQSNATTDTATGDVTKDCPVVIATCNAIRGPVDLTEGGQGTYTIAATAQNTTVTSIAFSVDGTVVQTGTNTSFVYTAVNGTHKIAATVTFANGTVSGGAGTGCEMTVTVKPIPKTVKCTGIDGTSGLKVNEQVTLTALSDNDALVASYVWTGVTTSNRKTATVSFDKDGTYKVTVTITPIAGVNAGTPVTCEKTITVTPNPVYACDLLTLSATSVKVGDKVTATVKYTAKNGAAFKSAVVDFGETTVDIDNATNGSLTADHTYAAAKDYDVTALLVFSVNGETVTVPATNCAGKVTVAVIPVDKCKISGKEQFDANDTKNCVAVLAKATTLINTGPGDVAGIFAATTLIGAVFHRLFMARRTN